MTRLNSRTPITWTYDGFDRHGRPLYMGKSGHHDRGYTLTLDIEEKPQGVFVTGTFTVYGDRIYPFLRAKGTYASTSQMAKNPQVVLTDEILDLLKITDEQPTWPTKRL